jgi:NAD(P)-dependent dehydrogenase (short-subunit alcohol dehydrogenase family)
MNIVVTGTARGIGKEVVKVLSENQENCIVAISRNGMGMRELVSECLLLNPGSQVIPYEFDLAHFERYPLIVPHLGNFIQTCDILINNAGKLVNKSFDQFTPDEFDDTIDVNIKSPFFLIQALLPMLNKGAHIVNIGSMGGMQGSMKFPGLAAYSASKGALAILTEVLAEELAPREIRVNCLAIGAVETEMFLQAFPGATAMQSPQQIARFIADFAVSGQKYFNGKVLPVSVSVP